MKYNSTGKKKFAFFFRSQNSFFSPEHVFMLLVLGKRLCSVNLGTLFLDIHSYYSACGV